MALAVGACRGSPAGASGASATTIRLYTTVQQPTVDAVVAALGRVRPGIAVDVFRAPTGEVAARIAAEEREGGIRADVLWLSDPLSMESYASRDLLLAWSPSGSEQIDAAYAAETYWGTRILNMVIVSGSEVEPPPASWEDLTDERFRDAVAIPDPAFAGSAFGALGHFALEPDYGFDFLRRLEANGAVQVKAPDEVTTGVAEGRFKAGMTLDFSVRQAAGKGSPVKLVWPRSGSIAIFSPIAVVAATERAAAAEAFVELVLSREGQAAIGATGWQPVLEGTGGPVAGGAQVRPDWSAAVGRQDELLGEYRSIFGP